MVRNYKTYLFEYQFFRYLLIAAGFFWIGRIVEAIYLNYYELIVADMCLLIWTVGSLFLLRYTHQFNWLRSLYCLILTVAFVFYWGQYGGLRGPVSYMYFVLITIFVALLPARLRELFGIVLGGTAVIMAFDTESSILFEIKPLTAREEGLMPYYYVFCTMVISILVGSIKVNFDRETKSLQARNTSLHNVNNALQTKINTLIAQREQISNLRENLELFVAERTAKLENKHLKLEQYAYSNAHFVRRHISNIMGLLNILDLEKGKHQVDEVTLLEIRKNTEELDMLIRQVNTILK